LFFEAARTHTNNFISASKGYGIDRHLSTLQFAIRDGEEVPLLSTDPDYEKKARPGKIMTDCLEIEALECGTKLGDPESLCVHFEPQKTGQSLNLTTIAS
jgi:hypothetical protein